MRRFIHCGSASSWCRRRASCSAARSATTSSSRRPTRPTTRSTPQSSALGLDARFDAFADGLDTEVHERGANFSAGERQLISLVRAALADPAVVVLDEATSSLDPGTELLVEHALERLMEGRTVIVIAHRLSTSERADLVAVVQGGSLAELGTHDELVRLDGHYGALFRSWTGQHQ